MKPTDANRAMRLQAQPKRSAARGWLWTCLAFVPGTRPFNRAFQGRIALEARKKLGLLRGLKSFDRVQWQTLLPHIRHSQNQLAATVVWDLFGGLFVLAIAILIGAEITDNISWIQTWSDPLAVFKNPWAASRFAWVLSLGYGLTAVICFIVWLFLMLIPAILVTRCRYLISGKVLLGWPIAMLAGYGGLYYAFPRMASGLPDESKYLGAAALMGGYPMLWFTLLGFLFFCVLYPCMAQFAKRTKAMYPAAVLADNLLQILRLVEEKPSQWWDPEFRQPFTRRLETAAGCAEGPLFDKLRAGDSATDIRLQKQTAQIAAGLRSLKQWVLTPKEDTRDYFIERIKADMGNAVRGNWAAMVHPVEAEPTSQNAKEKYLPWLPRIVGVLRTVVSGGIPIAVLYAVKRANIPIAEPMNTYLTVGVYLWAALTLISLLDPSYAERISGFKTLAGYFSKSSKSEKKGDDD